MDGRGTVGDGEGHGTAPDQYGEGGGARQQSAAGPPEPAKGQVHAGGPRECEVSGGGLETNKGAVQFAPSRSSGRQPTGARRGRAVLRREYEGWFRTRRRRTEALSEAVVSGGHYRRW
ncbi:hypothetical protein GCM10009753_74080 [Streptantibioticus ferralitis]